MAKRPGAEIATRVSEALDKVKMSGYAKSRSLRKSVEGNSNASRWRGLWSIVLDYCCSTSPSRRWTQTCAADAGELKSLQREVGITFIFVTHDQEEAMVMSDRIALLRSGELEQVATPREIYGRPATAYAAQFIGHTNLLRGRCLRESQLRYITLAGRSSRWDDAVFAAAGKHSAGGG